MTFSRQKYWSGLPCPPPGDLPNPGIKPTSPAFQADSLPTEPPGKILQVNPCSGGSRQPPGPGPGPGPALWSADVRGAALLSSHTLALLLLLAPPMPQAVTTLLQTSNMPAVEVRGLLQAATKYHMGTALSHHSPSALWGFPGPIFTSIQETGNPLMSGTFVVSSLCNSLTLLLERKDSPQEEKAAELSWLPKYTPCFHSSTQPWSPSHLNQSASVTCKHSLFLCNCNFSGNTWLTSILRKDRDRDFQADILTLCMLLQNSGEESKENH